MAEDLAIIRYRNEDPDSYTCRVLYSAAACWIKTIALDSSVISDSTDLGVSKNHITRKCRDIFKELLKYFPAFRQFVKVDDRWIQIIEERLLSHGDLVNVGFASNVTLSMPSTVRLTKDILCVKGALLQKYACMYSGIAVLQKCNDLSFNTKHIFSTTSWIKQYVKSVRWVATSDLAEDVEYFNPYCKSWSNEQCWRKEACQSINGIIFARELDRAYGNYKEYKYLLYNHNRAVIHVLDDFLIKREEQRRFMIGLRSLARNKVSAELIRYSDHVHLHLNVWLPATENLLLETYAWPSKSISEKLDWDMSIEIWNYIKSYLINLGLDIVEEDYHE